MPRQSKANHRPAGGTNGVPYLVRKTTLLPNSLREELVAAGKLSAPSISKNGKKDTTSVLGRKQRRKDERKQLNGKNTSGTAIKEAKGKQRAVEDDVQNQQQQQQQQKKQCNVRKNTDAQSQASSKKREVSFSNKDEYDDGDRGSSTPQASTSSLQQRKVASDKRTPLQKLLDKQQNSTSTGTSSNTTNNAPVTLPKGRRTAGEQAEDMEIAWLEAKLRRKANNQNSNSKKKNDEDMDEDNDGLDGTYPSHSY